MIPADLASRLRLVSQELPAPVQPTTPARQITDVLSDLTAGQRIMAEVQALLPNGMYRAVVAQRDITLALPFSAKPGDTLELEVLESDGKLTLAFVANRSAGQADARHNESVSTTLSKTGNLIGNLLNEVDQQGGRPKPAALNANQPLVTQFPDNPAELVPILKESLSKSGMFYEAHQARWVEGKLTTASLLQEPQGKFSPSPSLAPSQPIPTAGQGAGSAPAAPSADEPAAGIYQAKQPTVVEEAGAPPNKSAESMPGSLAHKAGEPPAPEARSANAGTGLDNSGSARPGPAVLPELTPIVQQQLNALATNNYVWQGQVWPGQVMHWEITEDEQRAATPDEDAAMRWQTRVKLDLPHLGGIDATLRLGAGGKLELSLVADNDAGKNTLQSAGPELGLALQAAGLQLSAFSVSHGEISR